MCPILHKLRKGSGMTLRFPEKGVGRGSCDFQKGRCLTWRKPIGKFIVTTCHYFVTFVTFHIFHQSFIKVSSKFHQSFITFIHFHSFSFWRLGPGGSWCLGLRCAHGITWPPWWIRPGSHIMQAISDRDAMNAAGLSIIMPFMPSFSIIMPSWCHHDAIISALLWLHDLSLPSRIPRLISPRVDWGCNWWHLELWLQGEESCCKLV